MEALLGRKLLLVVFSHWAERPHRQRVPSPKKTVTVRIAIVIGYPRGKDSLAKQFQAILHTARRVIPLSVHQLMKLQRRRNSSLSAPSRLSTTLPGEATLAFTTTSIRRWRPAGLWMASRSWLGCLLSGSSSRSPAGVPRI